MSKEQNKSAGATEDVTEDKKISPVIDGNIRIYRYMNRKQDQSFTDWSIDVYLHNPQRHSALIYNGKWARLMDVIDEIEKEEVVSIVRISGKATTISFKDNIYPDITVKVSADVDKKEACWRAMVNFMYFLEKQKSKKKK